MTIYNSTNNISEDYTFIIDINEVLYTQEELNTLNLDIYQYSSSQDDITWNTVNSSDIGDIYAMLGDDSAELSNPNILDTTADFSKILEESQEYNGTVLIYFGIQDDNRNGFPDFDDNQYFILLIHRNPESYYCIPIKSHILDNNIQIVNVETFEPLDFEYLSAKQVQNLIYSLISKMEILEFVETLPPKSSARTNCIYLLTETPSDPTDLIDDGLNLNFGLYTYSKTINDYKKLDTLTFNIKNFVKKTDIVNNLTSTAIDAPLSAKQGKILNDNLASHTHGNIANDGKISNSNSDTFQYFVGIGNSNNSLYKAYNLRADKVKDINEHTNINTSANATQDTINTAIDSALDNKIDKGNIQGGVNLLGQWLISYTNAGAEAVVTQQNNVLFHGDEVVRINNSSISDTRKYTDMYWETPYTEFGYNDVFTFSFYAKGTNNAQIKTYFYGESGYITVKRLSSNSTVSDNDTEYSGFNDGNTTFALASDWQFYTVTYKLNSIGTTTAIKKPVIRVFGGTDCYVSCAKLERGFNATDFNNGTGIKSIKIEATSTRTKDLNNYTKTGFYYNNLNADCVYISNLPVSNKAFFLTVENWGGSTTYLKQTCTVYSPVETYVRVKNSGTWGGWKKLISVDDASSSKGLADDPYNGLVGTSTKYAREDHAHGKLYHWSTGGVTTATYVDLLEFTMTTNYQDIPITFVVRRRAKDRAYYVSIRFSNTNISTSTYSVTSFKHWGDVTAQTFYLRKVADNTYRLCTYKTANDVYYIDDVVNFNTGITITKIPSADGNYGTTAPSGSAPNLYTSTYIGVPDTDLTWNGNATNNSISPLLMATDNEFGANRLAYFPPSRIKVEYSTDSGSTWTELTTGNYSEANKTKLVTTKSPYMYLGNGSTTNYSKNRLRITFDVGDMNTDSILYLITRKIALFTGTANSTGFTCQIQTQTYAQYNTNNETFNNYGTAFALGGWSGWNTAPLDIILGGYKSSNQTNSSSGRIKALRLLFTQTGGTGNGFVAKVRLYGETAHKTASQYANNNHIYTIDENQNAIFPSKIIKEGGTSDEILLANGDVTSLPTIVDNLTTNDATKVLSAKQGKVLNDLIGDAITYINGTGGN